MNDREAAGLARLLIAAFPDSGATAETVAVYARRIASWPNDTAAERAVDRVIDEFRRLPSVRDLRDAYAIEAEVPDPGRDMSPPVVDPRPLPTAEERAEIARMAQEIRAKFATIRAMQEAPEPGAGS